MSENKLEATAHLVWQADDPDCNVYVVPLSVAQEREKELMDQWIEAKQQIEKYAAALAGCRETRAQVQEANQRLRSALEQYADQNNWCNREDGQWLGTGQYGWEIAETALNPEAGEK